MKILAIHSDYIKFEPKKKAIKNAEETKKGLREVKECLVVLTAVEKRDEKDIEKISKRLVKEIIDIAKQIKTKKIVLYPYAHLSKELANPDKALKIMKSSEIKLKKKFKVVRAPFGYYKSFVLSCKGHPLSELSREFSVGEEEKAKESKALKGERKLKSNWHIMDTKGKLYDVGKFNFKKYKNLEKFAKYEKLKDRVVKEQSPHIKLMRKLELVDYEPASDPGNFRYYPKGRLIKSLLEQYVSYKTREYGGLEVETPIMYDIQHSSLSSYLNKFPARQYNISSAKKDYFLRFSACFGQFLMAHDANISYKHLPLKLYELTRYSFRREQRGELTGLRRLRAFTMPDVHALCKDMKQAMKEFKIRFKLCEDTLSNIGFDKKDFELAIRFTKDFYKENKKFIQDLVKKFGKPVLIETWDKRIFYFVLKYEFNFVDSLNKASALSTDQIDVENGERYNIKFVDEKSKEQYPLILHCSPSGAIERIIYALLEKAHLEEKKGKSPILPLWLSPTQIRIVPVSIKKHLKFARKVASEFEKENIRVDIDDDVETVGKRIRNSELEWTPYTIVIGDEDIKRSKLNVRIRKQNKVKLMSRKNIIKMIKKEVNDMPFVSLPLPMFLSKRPKFVG